ncbi:kinase-like protein, partial [Meira miltonrushii]
MANTAEQQQKHKHLLGHTIADGRLELVSILGLGAYGVVYLARDLTHPLHRQPFASSSSSDMPRILASRHGGAASGYYAVKCLNKVDLDARQKRFQRREIVLHTMVTGHPSVVTLYRVIDEKDDPCIYVILDYSHDAAGIVYDADQDEQYQQDRADMDETVRDVFCQILDAVQFCHANGIYHRDLKPENILCLQGGAKVTLADFGLATHEKTSSDFGCGSTFYMGPECQGGISTHLEKYSTAANDVWSLGVILVNLICGRNPWKQACVDDETFREYLRNPDFLMDILPISKQTNSLLKRVFTVREDWRCSLAELRSMVHQVERFTAT